MTDDLSSRLLVILGNPSKPVYTITDILRTLGRGYAKKDVNRCLYTLKGQRRVSKVKESPPEWCLARADNNPRNNPSSYYRNFEMGRGRERNRRISAEHRFSRGSSSPLRGRRGVARSPGQGQSPRGNDIRSQILHLLLSTPLNVNNLVVGIRGGTAALVMPILLEMEQERVLCRIPSRYGEPLWAVVSNDGTTSRDNFQSDSSESSFFQSSEKFVTQSVHQPTPSNITADLNSEIMSILSCSKRPITALEIAHLLERTRQEVNPCLYPLEKKGMVQSLKGDGSPKWRITLSSNQGHVTDHPPGLGRGLGLYKHVMKNRPGSSAIVNRLEGMSITETTPTKQSLPPHPLTKLSCLESNIISDLSTSGEEGIDLQSMMPFETISSVQSTEHQEVSVRPSASFDASVVGELNKNPVSLLLEYCQANKFSLEFKIIHEEGPPHMKIFVMRASFNDLDFDERSTTKKDAKRMVAETALQYLRVNRLIGQSNNVISSTTSFDIQGDSFECRIASLAHENHSILESTSTIPQPGRKVIACFILEDAVSNNELIVISFGTGTRCVNGEHLSMKGDVINDSHAEVLARRGLVRYLYDELHNFYTNKDTIFERNEDENNETKSSILLRIKKQYRFHLYISTAPCGDGAQFSRDDNENKEPSSDGAHKPTINTKQQGLLRTKMEGGEGTIPIAEAQQQTWDGIQQGERLRTMSCSDKIGRWNILGLQGALLSHFICPVYMSTLTLGSLHHHGHLSRAVCCRFDELKDLVQLPYQLNHPSLGRITGGDDMKRHTEKTTHYSMNWVKGDEYPEVTNGTTGRPVSNPLSGTALNNQSSDAISRVSKAMLFKSFTSLCKTAGHQRPSNVSYAEAKQSANLFQQAKEMFYKFNIDRGFGLWMKKPSEQSTFTLRDLV